MMRSSQQWGLLVLSFGLFVLSFIQYMLPVHQNSPIIPSKVEFLSPKGISREPPELVNYHMVFSTSCSPQQDWESLVFFYHARKVKQPGNITRIASGCTKQQADALTLFHRDYIQTMSPHFHLHLTPDYSRIRLAEGYSYKYMNKPYGLLHWFEHAMGIQNADSIPVHLQEDIVMLLDPDMILLRPLLHDFTKEDVIWVEDQPRAKVVMPGHPISQQDGYLTNEWMRLKVQGFTEHPPWNEGPKHWNSGPPYLATLPDMFRLTVRWTEMAPKVLDVFPKLFAEMYGLIIASVQLQLPFTFIKSIVVSTTATKDREGWEYIDALSDNEVCDFPPKAPLPIGLHYCKRYLLGEVQYGVLDIACFVICFELNIAWQWFFSKYRLKKNICNCDKALLKHPPRDIYPMYNYSIQPRPAVNKKDFVPEIKTFSRQQAKREAFMICGMVTSINEALRFYKSLACKDGSANLNETYAIHEDPSDH